MAEQKKLKQKAYLDDGGVKGWRYRKYVCVSNSTLLHRFDGFADAVNRSKLWNRRLLAAASDRELDHFRRFLSGVTALVAQEMFVRDGWRVVSPGAGRRLSCLLAKDLGVGGLRGESWDEFKPLFDHVRTLRHDGGSVCVMSEPYDGAFDPELFVRARALLKPKGWRVGLKGMSQYFTLSSAVRLMFIIDPPGGRRSASHFHWDVDNVYR